MPLSEEEQRILGEIERQLYETDEGLAHELSSTTVYTTAIRNMKFAVLGFAVGVAVMLFTLQISFWLAFFGFLIMLGAALFFERNARSIGRDGIEQLTRSMRPTPMARGEESERRGANAEDADDNSES